MKLNEGTWKLLRKLHKAKSSKGGKEVQQISFVGWVQIRNETKLKLQKTS